jgi:uncharacterized protein YjbJ (UPF0337 family)
LRKCSSKKRMEIETRTPVRITQAREYAARRYQMKISTRYRLIGIFHEARGTVRGVIGKISANRILGAKGNLERLRGKLQYRVGRVQGAIGL